ncbi:glycosyltransferase family 57 protein [Polychaeton citri CBS 116435]|uniref:Alpha-1,3-glucosyltransferase n=1 Tax=Polychaeton citri CBS 116435 TaxID=1314669 RepID=A0A9P4QGG0_9PEZI|nr:glycosyltransferase family 57 protein [Polychaeton citri CBS 116435]
MPPPNPAAYKPRRKRKADTQHGDVPQFPLAAFLWPARGTTSTTVTIGLLLMAVGLFRWCLGFWPYSGMNKPPMHGDFEAQRHWMEITTHLPVSHWYWHDLEWWGLDYPPLTAYHSWLCGKIGALIEPSWFGLYLSRRTDEQGLKVFMRATVIVSEYLTYVPATVLAARQVARLNGVSPSWEQRLAMVAVLMQPATLLIDHGHFQYNTVMLGLTLGTVAALLSGRYAWASAAFVGALGFKQMALFYAPAIGAYMLGSCIIPSIHVSRFLVIALSTLISFAVLVLPLIAGTAYDVWRSVPLPSYAKTPPLLQGLPVSLDQNAFYYPYILQLAQMVHRVFPFARGLFEDKVANVWCALHSSGIHKLTRYDQTLLQRAALVLTLGSIMPACLILLFSKRRRDVLLEGLAACSWGFFLFAFQVHEKSVLLPLLPMTSMLAYPSGMFPEIRAWIGFANILGCWTMFPLLKRDELRIPYFVLTLLWAWLMGIPSTVTTGPHVIFRIIFAVFYAAMIAWHVGEAFVRPPEGKPDIWVVGNVCIGAAGFGLCYLWCLWRCVAGIGLIGEEKKEADQAKKKQ